ncbi:MAG TPA: autotransporter domain-containing protein [Rhizomicrobium sp.]|nr:autotransporter domain-containing protein [Rhizomicrobium sp.]
MISSDAALGATAGTLTINGGTLQATSTTSGARSISLGASGGTFDVLSGITLTEGGLIAGVGGLTKSGTGTLVLTANESYSGGTIVNAGTLQLGSGGSLSSGSSLTINGLSTFDLNGQTQTLGNLNATSTASTLNIGSGSLTVNPSSAGNFAGTISGTGSFTFNGPSSLALSNLNSFTGNITVNGGTLNGGGGFGGGNLTINGGTFSIPTKTLTFGTLSGTGGSLNMNGSFLTFTSNTDSTFAGTITGNAGQFTKAGSGTLTLTGDASSVTSKVVISGGTLQFGNGGAGGGFSSGGITDNGALAFNRSDAVTYAGIISGTGGVTKLGAGTLTLSGTSTYSGATAVNEGTLNVTGAIASSSVSVANGATLGGTGTVGSTTVASGGTLAPGNSIGTLTVNGNLTLASGSAYSVEVSPTAADRTLVSGTAGLNGNFIASLSSGTYSIGQRYTVVTATSGVSGTFASLVTSGTPTYVKGRLSYDANNVYLNLDPNALAPLLSNPTPNQQKLVSAIDTAVAAGVVPGAGFQTLYGLSGPTLNSALDQISGQVGPNTINAVGQASLSFLTMTAQGGGTGNFAPGSAYGAADAPHRAQLGAGETRVWAAAYGGHVGLSADAASGAASLSSSNVGMIGGADMAVDHGLLLGVTIGLGRQSFSSGNGSGNSDDVMFGVYARKDAGPLHVAGALGYGRHHITTLRIVTVSGTDVLQGKQTADDFGGRVEAGWRMPLDDGYSVTSYGALAVQRFESPAYAETALSGASTFALSYAPQTTTLGRSELGAQLDRGYALDDGILTLDLRAAWAHQLDDQPFTQASFLGLPGAAFQVAGVRPNRDTALLGLDLEIQNSSGLFFGIHCQGQFGAGTTLVQGLGNFGWRW